MGDRPLAPFSRRTVRVVEAGDLGSYRSLTIEDPAAPVADAGQFHMVSGTAQWGGGEDGRPFLPRALSFLSSDGAGRFTFLIDGVGPGTDALCALVKGDTVDVAGPFGNGFERPISGKRPLLIGGGIGAAPVLALADQLNARGVGHDLVLGFRSAAHAEVGSTHPRASIATDDGSVGHHGTVLDLLDGFGLAEAEVFACGPPGMLEAVAGFCRSNGVPASFALESPMACGFGACFGCAVRTADGLIRLCVDGPVLRLEAFDGIDLRTAAGA